MATVELESLRWRKSSHSGNAGTDCVELAHALGHTAVRDSKNTDGGALVFTDTAMAALLREV